MAYNPAPGEDPIFDAWKAGAEARRKTLQADTEWAIGNNNAQSQRSLQTLGRNAETGRTKMGASQRLRGVARSTPGEGQRNQFEGDVARQGEGIRSTTELQNQYAQRGLASSLAELYAQQETEAANSATRLRDNQDRQAALDLQRQQLAEDAKRRAEETQIAQLPPGIDFSALTPATPKNGATADGGAYVDGVYIPPGLDFSGFGEPAPAAAQTYAKSQTVNTRPKTETPKLATTLQQNMTARKLAI